MCFRKDCRAKSCKAAWTYFVILFTEGIPMGLLSHFRGQEQPSLSPTSELKVRTRKTAPSLLRVRENEGIRRRLLEHFATPQFKVLPRFTKVSSIVKRPLVPCLL